MVLLLFSRSLPLPRLCSCSLEHVWRLVYPCSDDVELREAAHSTTTDALHELKLVGSAYAPHILAPSGSRYQQVHLAGRASCSFVASMEGVRLVFLGTYIKACTPRSLVNVHCLLYSYCRRGQQPVRVLWRRAFVGST